MVTILRSRRFRFGMTGLSAGPRKGRLPGLKALLDRYLRTLERARTRRILAGLDDRMLADIGLSRGDVETECRKSRRR